MVSEQEEKLSNYIDALNERWNEQVSKSTANLEASDLEKIAQRIKALPEVDYPEAGFSQRVAGQLKNLEPKKASTAKFRWRLSYTSLAAAILLVCLMTLTPWPSVPGRDVVFAMGEKVNALQDYHGVLEVRTLTADKQNFYVRRTEIWVQGSSYALKDDKGVITVNNGVRKWQVDPQKKLIKLLPLLPDPQQGRFDLRYEAKQALNYPHVVVGRAEVAGRQTNKVEITPPGGLPYYLWIDAKTDLPVQLQTAMQNSVQTIYTFVSLEVNQGISTTVFTYRTEGFKVVSDSPGQQVNTVAEAAAIAGFNPLLPKASPVRIITYPKQISLDYKDTVLTETQTTKTFVAAPNSSLGKANGEVMEVLGDRVRWQQKDIEISIEGPQKVELGKQLAKDFALPEPHQNLSGQAKIKVPVNRAEVEVEQQQVDGGHSPWLLDPVQVAVVYVNTVLKATPAVNYDSVNVVVNTGCEAILVAMKGPAAKIYLQRVVRQDNSGIWSVVGYDPS